MHFRMWLICTNLLVNKNYVNQMLECHHIDTKRKNVLYINDANKI